MSRCLNMCFSCPSPQSFKVNLSKFHGTCGQHDLSGSDLYTCTHCKQVIFLNHLSEIAKCESCKENYDHFEKSCQHLICAKCALSESKCPICSAAVPIEYECAYSLGIETCSLLPCFHYISNQYLGDNKCPVCANEIICRNCKQKSSGVFEFADEGEIYCLYCTHDLVECEFSLEIGIRCKFLHCGHQVSVKYCKDGEDCPICVNLLDEVEEPRANNVEDPIFISDPCKIEEKTLRKIEENADPYKIDEKEIIKIEENAAIREREPKLREKEEKTLIEDEANILKAAKKAEDGKVPRFEGERKDKIVPRPPFDSISSIQPIPNECKMSFGLPNPSQKVVTHKCLKCELF